MQSIDNQWIEFLIKRTQFFLKRYRLLKNPAIY